jgi:hypothetical protein
MTQSQFLQLPLQDPDIRLIPEFEQARGIVRLGMLVYSNIGIQLD